jgi:hypothetical protein
MNGIKWYPFCLVLGGVGALMASLAELTSKGSVSTILRVREALGTYLGISTEPIYVVLLFIGFGVLMTFASQVADLKKSFYVGASIITIFLTIIPNGLPSSVGSSQESVTSGASEQGLLFNLLTPEEALAQTSVGTTGRGTVQVNLNPTDGKHITEVVLTVREPSSGSIVARSKFNSTPIVFSQRAARYLVVIEVEGYKTQTREINVTAGQTVQLAVDLESTWRPLPLQRLFRKY